MREPLRALFAHIYNLDSVFQPSNTSAGKTNPKEEKHAERLREWRKSRRKELERVPKTRPGRWENRSSPFQASPKVNWGVTGGWGEKKPLTRP